MGQINEGTTMDGLATELPAERFDGAEGQPHRGVAPTDICIHCGNLGKVVQGNTVKALLTVSLRNVSASEYRFCAMPTCPIVYFAADHTHAFTTHQLRERVYQKLPDDPTVWICYCFRYAVGEVRLASVERRHAIIGDITAGVQAGQCACDLRNPQGSCCLGNVRAEIMQK